MRYRNNRAGENKESGTNEITIKIVNGEKGKRYFIEVSTNGKQKGDSAGFPKVKYVITNEEQEAKAKMNLNMTYNISVSESKVKNMEEFMAKKGKGAELTGPVLKKVEFIPKKKTNALIINLEKE